MSTSQDCQGIICGEDLLICTPDACPRPHSPWDGSSPPPDLQTGIPILKLHGYERIFGCVVFLVPALNIYSQACGRGPDGEFAIVSLPHFSALVAVARSVVERHVGHPNADTTTSPHPSEIEFMRAREIINVLLSWTTEGIPANANLRRQLVPFSQEERQRARARAQMPPPPIVPVHARLPMPPPSPTAPTVPKDTHRSAFVAPRSVPAMVSPTPMCITNRDPALTQAATTPARSPAPSLFRTESSRDLAQLFVQAEHVPHSSTPPALAKRERVDLCGEQDTRLAKMLKVATDTQDAFHKHIIEESGMRTQTTHAVEGCARALTQHSQQLD